MADNKSACPSCLSNEVALAKTINTYDILRCNDCELRFAPTLLGYKAISYDNLYEITGDYQHHVREGIALIKGQVVRIPRARRVALDRITSIKPTSLLEVGCGIGNFLSRLEKIGIPCHGIDLSENAIAIARKHLSSDLHCGELSPRVFPGKTFQIICMWEVIEHLSNLRSSIGEILVRLQPGGSIFLSTPNYDSKWLWDDLANDPRSRPPVHVTFWNSDSLSSFLKSCGLEDIVVNRYSIPVAAAVRKTRSHLSRLLCLDSIFHAKQRATLLGIASRPIL